jgi:purine-binding chemotaxis protein CheW
MGEGGVMNQQPQEVEYVTATIGEQLFGLPIGRVLDVFSPDRLTRVPLAAPEIAGVLNLRGRIVTAIDMRKRLDLPPLEKDAKRMAIGVEYLGESYGLLVDQVGEVLKLPGSSCDPVPVNLDPVWSRLAVGVHRLDGKLMVVLDVDKVFERHAENLAA